MTLPFAFPDWMPPWMQLIVVIGVLLLVLAYGAMPFSVFGVKGRLEALEAQLEGIQSELRILVQRLPDAERGPYDAPALLRAAAAREPVAALAARPAEPPAPAPLPVARPAAPLREQRSPTLRAAARLGDAARERAEPRFDRPI